MLQGRASKTKNCCEYEYAHYLCRITAAETNNLVNLVQMVIEVACKFLPSPYKQNQLNHATSPAQKPTNFSILGAVFL